MRRRPNYRAIRIHLPYTVDELARVIGVCKATVRRWIKQGLPATTDSKPSLITGEDVVAFLKGRSKPKRCCRLDEFYCLSCREPRRAAYGEAEIASHTNHTLNVRALCELCTSMTHKRISLKRLASFTALVWLSGKQAERRLMDIGQACPDVHLEKA
jgi:excisionase family DNA binding protein